LQKITSQTRTIEIETSTAEDIPSDWNAHHDRRCRTWRHAGPAQGGHLEPAQRETGYLAPSSNPCQHCTLLKPARSLKPVRSGNPERAGFSERCDSKNAECSLFGPESPDTGPHIAFNAPPPGSHFEGSFLNLFRDCETVKL
jgi:hypothetical protein